MSDCITEFLNLTFKKSHKQSATFSYDIVDIPRITERVLKRCTCQTINRIDNNFQSLSKVCRLFVIQIRFKCAVQHLTRSFKVLMLDRNTSIHNILESFSVLRTKDTFKDSAMRMLRSNVSIPNIRVHTWFRIYAPAFSDLFAHECGYAILIFIV